MLGSMYFIYIIWPGHLFHIYSGQVNSISIILEFLVSWNSCIFRGYTFFLSIIACSIFMFKMYRKIQSYPNSIELIYLQNVKFCKCVFVIFLLFTISFALSGPYMVYTYDSNNISIIGLYIYWEEAKCLYMLEIDIYLHSHFRSSQTYFTYVSHLTCSVVVLSAQYWACTSSSFLPFILIVTGT